MIGNAKFFGMLLYIFFIRTVAYEDKHRIRLARHQIGKHVNQECLILLRHKPSNVPYQECIFNNAKLFTYLLTNRRIETEFIQLNGIRNHCEITVLAK